MTSKSRTRRRFPPQGHRAIGRNYALWILAAWLGFPLWAARPTAPLPRLSRSAPEALGQELPRVTALGLEAGSASGGTVLSRFRLEAAGRGVTSKAPVRLELEVPLKSGQRPPRLWRRLEDGGWSSVPSEFDWGSGRLSAEVDEAAGEFSVETGEDVYFHHLRDSGQVSKFTGAATWSLPLEVPSGAGGMSIPLTVSYSSDQINSKTDNVATDGSWLGLGFELDVGRITAKPNNDPQTTYSIAAAGQNSQLVLVDGGQPSDCSQDSWTCEARVATFSTKEANFWKIEQVNRDWRRHICWCPYCTPPQNIEGFIYGDAYWRAWDQNGTRYEFGVGSVGGNRGYEDLPWNTWASNEWDWKSSSRSYYISGVTPGSDAQQVIYAQFGLEKVVDVHGNTLEVHWRSKGAKRREHGCSLPKVGFKESYPERILYTTNPAAGDTHAEYEIVFETSPKNFDTLEDAGIAQTSRWLDAIKIYFHPVGMPSVLIKEYRFLPYIDTAQNRKAYFLDLIEEYGKGGELLRTLDPHWVLILDAVKLNEGPGSEHDRWFFDGLADNGYGGSSLFTYQPFDLYRSRRQLASTLTIDPGFGTALTSSYAYFEPEVEVIEPNGGVPGAEALIGFKRVHETSPGGVVNRAYFHAFHDDPGHWLSGKTSATEVWDANGTRRARTDTSWGKTDLSVHHRFVYQTESLSQTWGDEGDAFATREVYQYLEEDQNCHHPTQPCGTSGAKQWGRRTRTFFYPDVNQPWTLLTHHRYAVNEAAQIVRKVQDRTLRNDGSAWTTLSRTDYLYGDGSLDWKVAPNPLGELRGSRSQVDVTLDLFTYGAKPTYDAFGNVVVSHSFQNHGTSTAWPTGGGDSTTTFDSDHHLFPTVVTNALGHQSSTRYYFVEGVSTGAGNGLPGQPKRVTDANGVHQVFNRFDNHGRLTHRWNNQPDAWILPLATEVRSYTDGAVAGTGGSLTVSGRDDAGAGPTYLWSATFFDGLGRRVQTQKEAVGSGQAMVVNTHYDSAGSVSAVTRAHKEASTGGFLAADYQDPSHPEVHTEYDALRRPSRAYGYDGSFVETEYDVGGYRGTRITDAELSAYKHVKQDAYGRTVAVVEGAVGGPSALTTLYDYDDLGHLLTATDPGGNVFSWTYDALGRTLSENDPDRGLTTFAYNGAGQEIQRTDALGHVIGTGYDLLGRKVLQTAGSTGSGFALPDRTWAYDQGAFGIGRLSSAVSRGNLGTVEHQRSMSYDSKGRLGSMTRATQGVSFTTTYGYDSADRVIYETGPDGEAQWTTFNNAGLPASLQIVPAGGGVPETMVTGGYDAEDRLALLTFGNGTSQAYQWYGAPEAFRLKRSTAASPARGGPIFLDLTYAYDDNGRITSIAEQGAPPGTCGGGSCAVTQNFTYDFLGRVTGSSAFWTPGAAGVYDAGYEYDGVGNLTAVTFNGVRKTYAYDPAHPHAVRWRGGVERYLYDDAGNMVHRVSDQGNAYDLAWTPFGQLQSVSGASGATFHWGPDGELVWKESGWGNSVYYAGEYELDGTEPVKYYTFAGKRVAVRRGGILTYLAADHLGSNSVATDSSGQLVSQKRYLPFGAERYSGGGSATDRSFAGERRHDDAGGLFHMGARFYDPELRRWTSADTILPDVYASQQLNRYTYALNNPLSFVDPSGHYVPEAEDG
ncbi:MAG: hypothetical protein KDD47_18025, partial [Acidobacteria bacterium]|nr:hypothetical protein [Acidobacteriota bacterium]